MLSTEEQHKVRALSYVVDSWGKAMLFNGKKVEVPTWQALDVRDRPQGTTIEQTNCTIKMLIPSNIEVLQKGLNPSLPWAENQFLERVGGEPLNPGETYKEWPWYAGNVEQHKEQGQFSHTYMERYWPKRAEHLMSNGHRSAKIGDALGDLNDVVNLLAKEPTTRQAYLPVWFPFDTGAVHGERVPCSLGYLFLMREGKLNITYYIRSCDFLRHFRDDVYMTARLCQWVLDELCNKEIEANPAEHAQHGGFWCGGDAWPTVTPGRLTMHIGSLHVFEGDLPKLRREYGA